MAFAVKADLDAYLQQTTDTTTATLVLDLATEQVRTIVGQKITQATATAHLWVDDPTDRWLWMPQRPVTAVTAVTIDAVAVTNYTVLPHALWREDGWIDGSQDAAGEPIKVTVAHTYGYATIPDDIKAACLHLAAQMYANPDGAQSERIDDYAVSRTTAALPPIFEASLRAKYGASAYVL